ncbi:MAG: MmcQ/YjbR family DNA-binding protein [Caldilinea sp.]|nr:MmcQ/YjbR family DNA-binding protein [Caldilinea sp.]MCB0060035.1 MmcQ/YjbR family DNA-binding protein [Caldilineaceae bacterium]MCB0150268.1 MmcQ/YjbR family DNA-binding protein [Caldilineaceae bacterium]MCB9118197.1 MmcQ/YjbR family DNA-binding protein [Caldilineaceae bacterium]MCB9123365.1 MmcQ/YjbR family DNA-binding protein [Caldilineaceae bacterium]
MTLDELRALLLDRPGVTEETPFGPDVLVYKVAGKIFALLSWNALPLRLSLKCRPGHSEVLRAEYAAITPGYHLNKRHWNTLALDGTLPDALVGDLIDESYVLVVDKLPLATRRALSGDSA